VKLDDKGKKAYLKMVKDEMPPTKHLATMSKAFILGGTICCIGQAISDLLHLAMPTLSEKDIGSYTILIIIAITGLLTGIGVYDKIGNWGGAGSIVPITGFANSIVSSSIERKREGVILGLCSNMFSVAGPVIVIGITSSVIVGLIYWIIGLFA